MTIITQDGRKLEVEDCNFFYDSDGREQNFFAGDTCKQETWLGRYGYWLVAELVAEDIRVASAQCKAEFQMPPFMSTAKEYHTYQAAPKNINNKAVA